MKISSDMLVGACNAIELNCTLSAHDMSQYTHIMNVHIYITCAHTNQRKFTSVSSDAEVLQQQMPKFLIQ